ncbi:MAG: glutamate-5-semialdehyde dehydrogenase, partial [Thermoanaerobaculia bacterium]|nr:glutamate-5-semialdehyde dehydrogenase [Thermoanaerobaculia bacterium]
MPTIESLEHLEAGMPIVFGGNRVVRVSEELASRFAPGDSLVVVQSTGDLLHVPRAEREVADSAVASALQAFGRLNSVEDAAIERFK